MRQFINIAKALSDEHRVRILMLLKNRALCVYQIIELLKLPSSTVSSNLAILLQADLLECHKDGRRHFYRMPETSETPLIQHTLQWLRSTLWCLPSMIEKQERTGDGKIVIQITQQSEAGIPGS